MAEVDRPMVCLLCTKEQAFEELHLIHVEDWQGPLPGLCWECVKDSDYHDDAYRKRKALRDAEMFRRAECKKACLICSAIAKTAFKSYLEHENCRVPHAPRGFRHPSR
jgi:hypothetical protein